ncbi:MAG TPA: hypothetical protein DCM28_19940 [Phycisphaerales bacterium]|nr:hypothetical protein [Phycisphaerales bacterium]HCD33292.1 hypothetical protein [Phycisphaerales bacterium]|tara:strand:- start:1499 stop:1735 length:237 start_codon:yes stop_codon:yes gene_type:complete
MAAFALHQLIIGIALALDFVFMLWAIRRYTQTGENMLLCGAIGSTFLTVTLVSYLVYFNRRIALINHLCSKRCDQIAK